MVGMVVRVVMGVIVGPVVRGVVGMGEGGGMVVRVTMTVRGMVPAVGPVSSVVPLAHVGPLPVCRGGRVRAHPAIMCV